jgi:dienelactone hydrolase
MKMLLTTYCILALASTIIAEGPRVFPKGKLPDDIRLKPLKDLNGHFPFRVPKMLKEWEARKAELRRRVLVANGLYPMPPRTPLNAVVHGKVTHDGFTSEKVYFESVPGFFVTGILFRPADKTKGKRPAVLCPHGHGGRLQMHSEAKVLSEIKIGAEKFKESGRMPKVARAVTLARLGNVVLLFDMIGYADSVQLSYQLAHRFAKQRPDMEGKKSWGIYSTQAELRLQSIMGLQTWNGIRALDFLASLPDVDPKRMAVTGGSGGGTQTILLCAIDPRPIAAFPNGMVSTSMQGGCTCENCTLLRIGTGNVELAALFAPKPQGMTAANDWTKAMMTDGFPELQKIYSLYGKKKNVICTDLTHFKHNYNYVSRGLMYDWFNVHMTWGNKEPIEEKDFKLLSKEEHAVWNTKHPKPKGGDAFERQLTKWIANRDAKLVKQMTKPELRAAWGILIGRGIPAYSDITRDQVDEEKRDGYNMYTDILRLKKHGEAVPVVSLFPTKVKWNKKVAIGVMGNGKDGMFGENGEPVGPVRKLLDAGFSVVSADLFQQGEFLKIPLKQTRKVGNSREFAGYSFGYNHTLFAHRVHDILTVLAWVRGYEKAKPELVCLVGIDGAGPWVAAARAIAGDAVDKVALDTEGFRFADLKSYRDPNFLPGAVKYGDLSGLLKLSNGPLWLDGEGAVPLTDVTDWLMQNKK